MLDFSFPDLGALTTMIQNTIYDQCESAGVTKLSLTYPDGHVETFTGTDAVANAIHTLIFTDHNTDKE